ncbi:TetR/AcrR family transcriptional regulator [Marinomonas sp.]|uniref:TetR/AcrR family transcriptional regulator n=1 Tax=Marinomonas sp. TaxID=1904862 RepID=UPI003BAC38B3
MPGSQKVTPKLDTKGLATRKPQQNRSVASLHRMFNATLELLYERKSEDFTLQEVSIRGDVSIGSIYYRFKNKNDLVREVFVQSLSEVAKKEEETVIRLKNECSSLNQYVPKYVAEYANILRSNELLMRLSMNHASIDLQASVAGNAQMKKAMEISVGGLLHFQSDITGNASLKASIVFQIVFAALARHLSLDSADDSFFKQDWDDLIVELGVMCLSYLKSDQV